MAQRKPAAPAALSQVGIYALDTLLRRDRLGEVYRGAGPSGAVRVRICPPSDDPAVVTAALDRVAAIAHPAVARVLDQLVDDAGRVALVTPLDAFTLADRRKQGRVEAATVGPLGCVLLDGLAALHAGGVQHGAVSSMAVGIDAEGSARWSDAGLLPALSRAHTAPQLRAAADVAECAALLRDLGRLPMPLEAVLDPVASGVPGAIDRAGPLATAWREALAALEMPVPPRGVRARIPGLLGPPAKPRRVPHLRRPLPGWTRPVAAALLIAAALGVVPAAALGPGGSPLLDRVDAYAPVHHGLRLTYRLQGSGLDLSVSVRVADARVIAGVLTSSLEASASDTRVDLSALPLGLGGGTVRVLGDSVVRTASGGAVRDLVLPLTPGASWSDTRTGTVSVNSIAETRRVLGPVPLDVAAGHFDRCVAVALSSTTHVPGASPQTGTGTLWFCPGVGLARALLQASGRELSIELVSVH